MQDRNATTSPPQDQADIRAAVLGPIEPPCCPEHAAPCEFCLLPEDVPYEPTPEDEAWYRETCAARDARLWEDRIEADSREAEADARLATAVWAAVRLGGFRTMLVSLRDGFQAHATRPDCQWIGDKFAALADQAEFFGATNAGQFEDRLDAMLDQIEWSKS